MKKNGIVVNAEQQLACGIGQRIFLQSYFYFRFLPDFTEVRHYSLRSEYPIRPFVDINMYHLRKKQPIGIGWG